MIADRNWGLITSGATFEALATTLVYFEDPNAALFGRRGKDGGQDARSGDRTRVFQAKHHEGASALKAITDAKKEAEKIARYRKPGHPRYNQWKGVTHWRLVTNATYNPRDRERWDAEVVPAFKELGLDADYWEQANLDALLEKHPEVDRSYFHNETRAFLTLPEILERLPFQEPFLQRSADIDLVGRDDEIAMVSFFLESDKLFLVVHGAGGIGKTKLLVEAGAEISGKGSWQVFWANVASLEASGTWFEAILPERPTLLLVDEPEDEQLLRVLSEQLGGRLGRAAKWKVVVAVRSPKDPVLRFLRAPRMQPRVQELPVRTLSAGAAEAMCSALLGSGPLAGYPDEWLNNATRELARRFSQHPVWLTLAVHLLETRGDLKKVPETSDELAASYLDEVVGQQNLAPPEQMLSLLRWVALFGTVNREDDATIKLLSEGSEITGEIRVRQLLASLVTRRALAERGARNRLVEIKPDVMRDHILQHWLSVDVEYGDPRIQPSDHARNLVASVLDAVVKGGITPLERSILDALARTEIILGLSGHPVPLLDPFFQGVHNSMDNMTASARVLVAEVLPDVATVRPMDTVSLSRTMRLSAVPTEKVENLFETREISQDDVVLELAWAVYHAAMGAQEPEERQQVFEELCALAEMEAEIALRKGLPNDGKRAGGSLERVLAGGPNFWGDFGEAAEAIGLRILEETASQAVSKEKAAAIKAVLEPATSLERTQTQSEDYSIRISRYVVLPNHPAWNTRASLLRRLKEILASHKVAIESRTVLWDVLADAHRDASRCRGHGDEAFQSQIRQELLDDLKWAKSVLVGRNCELEELKTARNLWSWHHRFEQDPELKTAADELEDIYGSNALVGEFDPLTSYDLDMEEREESVKRKAAELAAGPDAQSILDFIERAVQFLSSDDRMHEIFPVSFKLGKLASGSEAVQTFVRSTLSEPKLVVQGEFAAIVASTWVATLREDETPEAAHELVGGLLGVCGIDETRIRLLERLYGGPAPGRHIGRLTSPEHERLRSLGPLFIREGRGPSFLQAVGWTIHHDWPGLKSMMEQVLDDIPLEQIPLAANALVDSIHWAIREGDPAGAPPGLGPWLLDQVLRTPDIDQLGDHLNWHVEEVLKRLGRVPITWLAHAIPRRMEMEAQEGYENVHAISGHTRLSRYVSPIEADQINDAEIIAAVRALVDLAMDTGTVGFHMPVYLRDIDPNGLLIPTEVAERIAKSQDRDEVQILAKIAGSFGVGSAAWRQIAEPVFKFAHEFGKRERWRLFGALTYSGLRTWSGKPGEVPDLFIINVETAKKHLETESDPEFKPFWEWNLTVVEAELNEEEGRAKEDRGE